MNFLRKLVSIFRRPHIDLSGSWTGHYAYGQNYPEAVRNTKVTFASLIIEGSDGSFTGTITESDNGIPEIATIEGTIGGRKIRFTKTYKSSYGMDDEGNITKTFHGPHHVIYEGSYYPSKKLFSGMWRIEATYLFNDGRELFQVSTGFWQMTKD